VLNNVHKKFKKDKKKDEIAEISWLSGASWLNSGITPSSVFLVTGIYCDNIIEGQ
jgi:hypothetical protein